MLVSNGVTAKTKPWWANFHLVPHHEGTPVVADLRRCRAHTGVEAPKVDEFARMISA